MIFSFIYYRTILILLIFLDKVIVFLDTTRCVEKNESSNLFVPD